MTAAMWMTLALVAVPVVLLLAITGCALDTEGIPLPPGNQPEPPPTYVATVLNTQGLAGYWRLGEDLGASEAANSATPGTWTGTYVDPVTLEMKGALEQDPDTAALFEGGYVEVSGMEPLQGGEVTVELWMRLPTDVPEWGVLVGCYELVAFGPDTLLIATGYRLRVRKTSASKLEVDANFGGMPRLVTPVPEDTPPNWHHVVLTYSKALQTAELYVDNSLLQSVSGQINLETPQPWPLRFATGTALNLEPMEPYEGLLDEVALYQAYLPTAEVDKHVSAAKVGPAG